MTRLLIRCLVIAAAVLFVPVTLPAQEQNGAERQAERAAERAERARDRAEQRAERARARAERRGDWQFETTTGAHIMIGKSFTLPEGSVATEGIIVVGSDATIEGTAEDDVLVVGGTLRVGPKAIIHGDVATVGGELNVDPAARIDGDVNTTQIGWPHWTWSGWPVEFPAFDSIWWKGAALALTIGRFALVLLLSVLVAVIAPRRIGSIASRLSSGPVVSAVAGVAAEIFFGPAIVLLAIALVITIVGIPLLAGLPFLLAAFALLWVIGYTAVAGVIGARLRGSDWYVNGVRPVDVVLGSLVLSSVTLFGQVLMMGSGWLGPFAIMVRGTGWTIEYLAWTVGLGAALTAWMRADGFNTRAVPPTVPPLPATSPSAL